MAITGPDGMNAPELRSDGVSSADWQELNARFFTLFRREAFLPDFAVGLAQALGNQALSQIELRRRITVSLSSSYLRATDVAVIINGAQYGIYITSDVVLAP